MVPSTSAVERSVERSAPPPPAPPPPAPLPPAPLPSAPLPRVLLHRARLRAAALPDRVEFAAGCPGCGELRQWTQTRDDTRLVSVIHCPCPIDTGTVAPAPTAGRARFRAE